MKVRRYTEKRFGKLKVQGQPFVHAGMDLTQRDDVSVTLTQEDFTENLKFPPTFPKLSGERVGWPRFPYRI